MCAILCAVEAAIDRSVVSHFSIGHFTPVSVYCSLGLLFNPDDRGSILLRNIGTLLPDDTTSNTPHF
jgi:hypothetical protein